MDQKKDISFSKDKNGVATITLNRPAKLNAFTHDMIIRWLEFLAEANDDPNVKVVLLTGAGRGFCAGGDMDEISGRSQSQDSLERKNFLWHHGQKVPLAVERLEKPLIVGINGLARGAGCDMALMGDIRIAAESASFAWSYVGLGIISGNAGTYYLPRIVGMDRALELLWTGRTVTAQEAERIRLVTRVVPDADLAAATLELATRIAAQPENAIQFYRRAAYQGQTQSLYSHLDMVSSHLAVLGTSRENRSRVEAFRESRREARSSATDEGVK